MKNFYIEHIGRAGQSYIRSKDDVIPRFFITFFNKIKNVKL